MLGDELVTATRQGVQVLDRLGIPYALVGGVAMNVWQRARATRDVDVLVCCAPDELGPLRDGLREAGFAHHERANHRALATADVYRFWWRVGSTALALRLDLLLGRLPLHRGILDRAVVVAALGIHVSVASTEDVILLKLLAGRPVDRVDVIDLVRIHGQRLDGAYLQSQADKLGLADAWRGLRAQAPGP